ncbi:hypothetical protein JCM11641_001162 [Rhodosporidiobolus odoratus]
MGASTDDSSSTQARPAHHVIHPLTGTLSFKNPWPSASAPTANELLFGGAWLGWPKSHLAAHPKARELQVLTPDWGKDKVKELKEEATKQGKEKTGFVRGSWLGHATCYVEIPVELPLDPFARLNGKRRGEGKGEGEKGEEGVQEEEEDEPTIKLLFDPIFSERAGPTSYTGPGRVRPPPCKVEELPGVDAVFVSHNHYDHLDHGSVKSVMDKWPRAKYFVPLGNKQWLFATGVPLSQIYELDWWDDVTLTLSDFGLAPAPIPLPPLPSDSAPSAGDNDSLPSRGRSRSYSFRDDPPRDTEKIRITCVPAQHNSGRSPTDQMTTLWSGWVVERLVETEPPAPQAPALNRVPSALSAASGDSFATASDLPPQQVISETVVEEPETEETDDSFAIGEEDEDDASSLSAANLNVIPPSQRTSPALATALGSSSSLSVPLDSPASSSQSLVSSPSASQPGSGAQSPLAVPKPPRRRRSSVREGLQRASSFSRNLTRRLSSSSNNSNRSDPSNPPSASTSPNNLSPNSSSTNTPSPLSRSSSLRHAREKQKEAADANADTERENALAEALSSAHLADSKSQTPGSLGSMPGGLGSVDEYSSSPSQLPFRGTRERADTVPSTVAPKEEEGKQVGVRGHGEVKESGFEGVGVRAGGGRGKRVVRKGAVYFAGDTGYRRHRRAQETVCPAFDELGRKFGPFDLSFVPIWRGGTLGFVSAMGLRLHHENISSALHGSPTDAVDIHLDVRSRNTIGMHFGTFIGSESEALEAIIELHEACEVAKVRKLDDLEEDEMGRMGVVDIGETWCVEISEMLIVS